MEVTAKAKFIRMSPRKVKLIIDLVRGLNVDQALTQLQFVSKAAVKPVVKLINSAIASAEENFNLDRGNLFVKTISATSGPSLKRWTPRAFGRATPIVKRSSHINIVLGERVPTVLTPKESTKVKDQSDLVKVESADEIKVGSDKKGARDAKSGAKMAKPGAKGFANKIFNRKSGEK